MKTLFILLALVVAMAAPVAAQTSITTTTLSAAVTSPSPTSKTMTVASASGISVGTILYIDGAVYRVTVVDGTTLTVLNQQRPATHLSGVTVYVVPSGAQIGLNPVGSCLRGTSGTFPQYSPYTLMFNLSTGDVAACRGGSLTKSWIITNPYAVQYSTGPSQSGI